MPEIVEVLVDGGKATAGPPIGPALGPMEVNMPLMKDPSRLYSLPGDVRASTMASCMDDISALLLARAKSEPIWLPPIAMEARPSIGATTEASDFHTGGCLSLVTGSLVHATSKGTRRKMYKDSLVKFSAVLAVTNTARYVHRIFHSAG